jgi:hypothetical protein
MSRTPTTPTMRRCCAETVPKADLSGQRRIRIRYRRYVTPWFDYFRIAVPELRDVLAGTGWNVTDVLSSDDSDVFIAIIDKT